MAAPCIFRLKCKGVQRWPEHLEVIEHLRRYLDVFRPSAVGTRKNARERVRGRA
jgi:hypothetical protein